MIGSGASDHAPGWGAMPTNTRPPELVATCKVAIVGMVVFKDRLFVATSEGVFERLDDGAFHEVRLVKIGDET